MNSRLVYLSFILLATTAISCDPKKEPETEQTNTDETVVVTDNEFDYGVYENEEYKNTFFSFTMKVPIEWAVHRKEDTERLVKLGKDLAAGDDKSLQATLDTSIVNTKYLFSSFRYKIGEASGFNPSIVITAEKLDELPTVETGNDYLIYIHKRLKKTQIGYSSINDEFKDTELGNKKFSTMETSIKYLDQEVKQMYHSTVINGYGLTFIISYAGQDQYTELDKVIRTIYFNSI